MKVSKKTVLILVMVVVASTGLIMAVLRPWTQPVYPEAGCPRGRALLIDALSTEFPNPDLDEFIVKTLEDAGYSVDFYNGSHASLEVFSKLAEYQVIIIRSHGALDYVKLPSGEEVELQGIVTGLPWNDSYKDLARKMLVAGARPFYNPDKLYLALLPGFFEKEMGERFCPGSVVIVASCFSLSSPDLSLALARKGLSTYIGWTGPVYLDELDESLKMLVELVFVENIGWLQAANQVNTAILSENPYGTSIGVIPFK